jgi:hypothetical protein
MIVYGVLHSGCYFEGLKKGGRHWEHTPPHFPNINEEWRVRVIHRTTRKKKLEMGRRMGGRGGGGGGGIDREGEQQQEEPDDKQEQKKVENKYS